MAVRDPDVVRAQEHISPHILKFSTIQFTNWDELALLAVRSFVVSSPRTEERTEASIFFFNPRVSSPPPLSLSLSSFSGLRADDGFDIFREISRGLIREQLLRKYADRPIYPGANISRGALAESSTRIRGARGKLRGGSVESLRPDFGIEALLADLGHSQSPEDHRGFARSK